MPQRVTPNQYLLAKPGRAVGPNLARLLDRPTERGGHWAGPNPPLQRTMRTLYFLSKPQHSHSHHCFHGLAGALPLKGILLGLVGFQ